MTPLLTRREDGLLRILAARPGPVTVRELSGELSLRGFRGVSERAVEKDLLRLAAHRLAWSRFGQTGTWQVTDAGWSRAGEPPQRAPVLVPVPAPAPQAGPEPAPDRVLTGQIWEGRGAAEGRRIRIGQVDAAAGMVYYRITRQRPGIRVPRAGGRCRIYSLLATYRLVSTPAAEEPAVVTHLMITDPSDPGHDDVFSRCCGLNWRSLAASGLITSVRELVNCPGRHD